MLQHPSQVLSKQQVDLISADSFLAELQGSLTHAQLQLIYDHDWFRIMVPESVGGLERSLPEIMRLLEAVAWADGSVGWVLNLGAGANMFAAYLPADISRRVFNQPDIYIAGSGALTGKAEKVDGGYKVNGMWRYASGASHASYFSFTCIIVENGQPVRTAEGSHRTRSFIVPKKEVTICGVWNSYGLKATASHDFKIQDLFVPENFSFDITAPSEFANGSLYKFPFLQLAQALLAVMMSGMSLHFVGCFSQLMNNKIQADEKRRKDYPAISKAIKEANIALDEIRRALYKNVEIVWDRYERGEEGTNEQLQQITNSAKRCASISRKEVEALYPWAGMDIIVPESELNRIWREIHTASQHILLSPFD